MKSDGQFPALGSTASRRNRGPILEVLKRVLPVAGRVLEVGSGHGEHAVYFSANLPRLIWQTSDQAPESRAVLAARAEGDGPGLPPPLDLDLASATWPVSTAAAMVAINVIHISPWAACVGLMAGAGRVLEPGGVLYLYGAFRVGGRHTAPSNQAFDETLRRRNPQWGVRDLGEVAAEAAPNGLRLADTVEMPNNNLSVVFKKAGKET